MTLKDWQQHPKKIEDLIVQASVEDGTDSPTECSIGMCYGFANIDFNVVLQNYTNIERKNIVFNNFNQETDIRRRGNYLITRRTIANTLSKNNIEITQTVDSYTYFSILPTYKFVISPEGNGIDCHRHYEALIAGCIPIVEENDLIKKKYGNCPILYTKDYSEITIPYLQIKYSEMIEQEYDFSKLFIQNWDLETQNTIKRRGNYWVYKYCNKFWYNT
jgi:hypothetical protein